MARAATPAIVALLTAEVPHQVLQYQHDPRNASFGEEAVEELARVVEGNKGIVPEQVFKTLVIALPKGLAAGGISPFGQRKPLPTVVDVSALRWDRVLRSADIRA